MPVKIQVVFYSMYGHVYRMAEAEAEGAREVSGTEVSLYQVPELVPEDVLEKSGAKKAREKFAHIPEAKPDQLAQADGFLFGTPTRYGNMAAQMRNFLDQSGPLWTANALEGKPAGVFVGTASQHGGQETTAFTFYTTLLHLGMIVVGVPYSTRELVSMDEITGGSPYGAGTLSGMDGSRRPSENELAIARTQGRLLADIARRLKQE